MRDRKSEPEARDRVKLRHRPDQDEMRIFPQFRQQRSALRFRDKVDKRFIYHHVRAVSLSCRGEPPQLVHPVLHPVRVVGLPDERQIRFTNQPFNLLRRRLKRPLLCPEHRHHLGAKLFRKGAVFGEARLYYPDLLRGESKQRQRHIFRRPVADD
ncbi:hypothetical protein D3C74_313900 [compost metagenome]